MVNIAYGILVSSIVMLGIVTYMLIKRARIEEREAEKKKGK